MAKVEILKQCGYNFLWIDGKLWMWDIPEEVRTEKELAEQCYGDVLIAGYGFGLCHKFLREDPKVSSITTIEKHWEVLQACKAHGIEVIGKILMGDFYEMSAPLSPSYDCVVGDIWVDISPSSLGAYKKFKEKALMWLKPGGKVLGWGSDYYEYLIGVGRR